MIAETWHGKCCLKRVEEEAQEVSGGFTYGRLPNLLLA